MTIITERIGGWIQTYTGREFYPLDPRANEIVIMDIAHALSNICRFTGHCKEFYSVAQHSVLVSDMCSKENKLYGLLHDASEAYITDIARPVKHSDYLQGYREVEQMLQSVIYDRFGLLADEPEELKLMDRRALETERRFLFDIRLDWRWLAEPFDGVITPLPPKEAKALFLERFHTLTY